MSEEKKEAKKKAPEADTPSALALAASGDKHKDDWKPSEHEAVVAQGEAYAAEKKKHRWG